jgi:MFS family permease
MSGVVVGRVRFAVLSAAVLVEAAGAGALYPLLARIQAAHHLPTAGLGLMAGASFFAALVSQVGLARFLDGPRAQAVLLVGLAMGAGAQVWFGLATDLWALCAARAIAGVSYGVVMPAALRASTVGIVPGRRGGRIGRLASVQMVGIVVGPLVGAGVFELAGLRAPFLVLGGAEALVLVALALLEADDGAAVPDGTVDAGAEVDVDTPLPRPTSRPVLAVLLVAVGLQLPNGLYDALWSRLLTDRGAPTLLIGLSLTCFAIPYVALAPLGGRLAGRRPLVWSGAALVVAACFTASYGYVGSPILITVLGVFEACAQSVAVPGGYAATAAAFPDRWAATGQGWSAAAGTAAAGTAALVGGAAYAALGPGLVFAGGAVASAGAAAAGVLVGGRHLHRHPATSTEPVGGQDRG